MTRTALTLLTATLLIPSALSFPTFNMFGREARDIEVDFKRLKRQNGTDQYGNSNSLNSTETLPMIIEPSNGTVWTTGETRNVTWTTTDQNGDVFDIIKNTEDVEVELQLQTRDVYVFEPISIANVSLANGWHTIVVPSSAANVGERNDWIIVLVGNPSFEFIIVPPSASSTPLPVPVESTTNSVEPTPLSTPVGTSTATRASSTPVRTSTEVSSMPAETSTVTEASSMSAETLTATEVSSMPAETSMATEASSMSAETSMKASSMSAETSTEASSMPAETSAEVSSMPFELTTIPTASFESTASTSEATTSISTSGSEAMSTSV